jgi:hypothetical protein
MAIDLVTTGTTGHPARQYRKDAYLLKGSVDLAEAATAKGSALATSDVINVIQIPAGTLVIGAYGRVQTAGAGGATTGKYDFGTTTNVNRFVHDATLLTGGYSAPGTSGGITQTTVYASAITGDIILRSVTGSLLTGVIEVGLVVVDAS